MFREEIVEESETNPDLQRLSYLINLWGNCDIPKAKEEYIKIVARYIGVEYKDISWIFFNGKKKLFQES